MGNQIFFDAENNIYEYEPINHAILVSDKNETREIVLGEDDFWIKKINGTGIRYYTGVYENTIEEINTSDKLVAMINKCKQELTDIKERSKWILRQCYKNENKEMPVERLEEIENNCKTLVGKIIVYLLDLNLNFKFPDSELIEEFGMFYIDLRSDVQLLSRKSFIGISRRNYIEEYGDYALDVLDAMEEQKAGGTQWD